MSTSERLYHLLHRVSRTHPHSPRPTPGVLFTAKMPKVQIRLEWKVCSGVNYYTVNVFLYDSEISEESSERNINKLKETTDEG